MVPVPKRGLELVLVLGEYRNIKIEKIKNIPPPHLHFTEKENWGISRMVCVSRT